MQANRISSTGAMDRKWQRAVLGLLLEQDPHQFTYTELQRELAGEKPSFDERDALARAVHELTRAGLIRRCEAMVLLTQPARHMASLELD